MSATGNRKVIIATRPSRLARWQATAVRRLLAERWPAWEFALEIITTQGDRNLSQPLPEIGGKGLFTQELEAALREGRVDMAIHSLKDLPIDHPQGIRVGGVLMREDARDVLIAPEGMRLDTLPKGAVVGTSSPRRKAQLLGIRNDLQVKPIRGNIETRVKKVFQGDYDAAILAAAGINRLGMQTSVSETFPYEQFLPAPGQGALGVQIRAGDHDVQAMLATLESAAIRRAVQTERSFLAALGGGCSAPVGAYAVDQDGKIDLRGIVASVDGKTNIRIAGSGQDPIELGKRLAEQALHQGAEALIRNV